MTDHLGGIVPPLCTPMLPDGSVDESSLRNLLRHQLESGSHGFFVLGSSGEAPYLTDAQREQVVGIAADEVAGRVPVLAGVIETAAPRVIEQARTACAAGADQVVATGPFYALGSPSETIRHFDMIAEAIQRPVIAYTVPSRTGNGLPPDVVGTLARSGTIRALKDSSGQLVQTRRVIDETSELAGFTVFTGTDALIDVSVLAGAGGAVPGLANLFPEQFASLWQALQAGDTVLASRRQATISALGRIIEVARGGDFGVDAAAYGAFKYVLCQQGIIAHPTTAAPQTPLTAQAKERIDNVISTVRRGPA